MKNPIISICIPAYKRIDYLKRLLWSIEIQKFKDFEVIISDDSNDHSVEELIKEFKGRFEIKYFKKHLAPQPTGIMPFQKQQENGLN